MEKLENQPITNTKELVSTLIEELEKRNLIKKQDFSFKEVENMLKNYRYLETSIELLETKLDSLEKEKNKLSKCLTKSNKVILRDREKSYYYTDETLESDINILKQRIIKIKTEKEHIDACLKELENDEYFDIIKMQYIENRSPQEVQDFYDISKSTYYENRNRLIRSLIILMRI